MKVCVIGLGIMGSAVVKKLQANGQVVIINNRSKQKADPLLEIGARWAASPAEAASDADVVITMVKDPDAVKDVTLGAEGILNSIAPHAVHAEMSTISPQAAEEIAKHYHERDKRFVQAPVLGSRKQIEDSTLLIMAGGNAADIETCKPVWETFSKHTWQMQSAGQAAAMKLSCNMLIAQMILGLGQSLNFAQAHDVDLKMFLDVLEQSALGTPMYKSKGQSFIIGNFQPNFTVANMLKDLTLANDAANQADCSLLPNNLAKQLFELAVSRGLSGEDYSAVIKVLQEA